MFHSARLQLTAWYLMIIMIISSLFSLVIYSSINGELTRLEVFQRSRQERLERIMQQMELPVPESPMFSTEEIVLVRKRVILTLVVINGGILLISGVAGYFLAGRTLRPIQEMLEEQKRFITDASHELRTPLTALRSEIEVSLRDPKLSLKEAKKLLASNLEEVVELQHLSDGLITLTRQQIRQPQVFREVQLLLVVESALKKVVPLARKKRILLDENISDVTVQGNRESLTELLVILLDNAIKYSAPKTKIRVISRVSRQSVAVQIIDQGMGITERDLPHIFDRFYRAADARVTGNVPGHGLGLSIAQKIVADHAGEMMVKSSKKGSTFTIKLPLRRQ